MVDMRQRPVKVLCALALAASVMLFGCGQTQTDTGDEPFADSTEVTEVTDGTDETPADNGDEDLTISEMDATVYTKRGKAKKLSEIADGKPLVINFWASWCPYCIDEMPDFQHICREYNKKISFAFVDVADGDSETVEDAKAWLKEQEINDLPVYFDTKLEASTAFGAYALPTTALVSADGEIISISAGRIDPARMRLALEELV